MQGFAQCWIMAHQLEINGYQRPTEKVEISYVILCLFLRRYGWDENCLKSHFYVLSRSLQDSAYQFLPTLSGWNDRQSPDKYIRSASEILFGHAPDNDRARSLSGA